MAKLEDGKATVPARQLVAKACTALAEALLVGGGEWGRGLFDDFGCYLDGKAASEPVAGHADKAASSWLLRVVERQDALELAVFYRPTGEASSEQKVATVTIPATAWTQDLLREQGYANLVAALVLDSLPAIRCFEEGPKAGAAAVDVALGVKSRLLKTRPLKPKPLVLFTWSYNQKRRLWMPHIIGAAKISGSRGKERWHLSFNKPTDGRPAYAGSLKGPGRQQDQLLSLLAKRQNTLLTNEDADGYDEIREGVAKAGRFLLLNTVESGYIGVRVGRELIDPSSAVIPPATVIGVIGEAAVWEGKHYLLRFWYARDISVPLASKVASVQSTLESSRAGLDALLKGPPIELFNKQWRLSYLLFIYHEDLMFSQKSQQAGPFNLEFSSAYAG